MSDLDFFDLSVNAADWESDRNLLERIRYAVFVQEQQVPVEIEMDDQDSISQHWLAFDPEGVAIGTARLEPNGKVGRMAVTAPFRGLGVGAALMRKIIFDASSQGMPQLTLHAQTHAIPFYEQFGFVCEGKEFDEAGIAHREMKLDLGPYRYRAKRELPNREFLQGIESFQPALEQLIGNTHREIAIYCSELSLELLSSIETINQLVAFATSHKTSEVRILIADTTPLVQQGHPLLSLFERLSSSISLRKLGEIDENSILDFWLFDQTGYISCTDKTTRTGYASGSSPSEVRPLQALFNEMWKLSEPDPQLRRLKI